MLTDKEIKDNWLENQANRIKNEESEFARIKEEKARKKWKDSGSEKPFWAN